MNECLCACFFASALFWLVSVNVSACCVCVCVCSHYSLGVCKLTKTEPVYEQGLASFYQ